MIILILLHMIANLNDNDNIAVLMNFVTSSSITVSTLHHQNPFGFFHRIVLLLGVASRPF